MKYLKLFFLLAVIVLASSCGKKIHISDVSTVGNKTFYEQKAYTGSLWTDDEKSGKFELNDGMLTSMTFYHSNGNKAIEMTVDMKTKQPSTKLWDDKGKEMSLPDFEKHYIGILINMSMVQKQIKSKH
jgi:hypothetical protein